MPTAIHNRWVLLALVLVMSFSVAPFALARGGWAAKVLAARDTDEKEFLVCRLSEGGVGAADLAKLIARERHSPAVASAAGQYLEKGSLDGSTPNIIRQLAKRPDVGAQALAYTAVSPSAVEIIVGFSKSSSKADHLIAARLLAATAMMRSDDDRAKMRALEKVSTDHKKLNVNYQDQLIALLGKTRDAAALEYLLLAVGIDQVMAAKDLIAPHAASRREAVAMSAQFALAGTGQGVDEAALLKTITRKPKPAKPVSAFGYDPKQTPRIYAIRAAGEARLVSAREPLMQLVNDKAVHTAVYAARALGRIGGEGLAVQLVKAMHDEMPWPVRIAIYDAAGANPDKAAVECLRQRYSEETGRLRQDALYALLSIVAGKPQGMDIIAFDEWWALHGQAFEVDLPATLAWRETTKVGQAEVEPLAGFYDSGVISDRPVFTVDTSLSMKGKQIESLKETLTDVVLSFPEHVKFNIVDFGGYVRTLAPGGLIPAKNRRQAMREFIYDMKLSFGTRSYDAIMRATALPEMDTVHFLSDGAPYRSHVDSWSRMNYVTRLYCSTAPVAIHIIYFPENEAKAEGKKLMQVYAHDHAGKYHVVVPQAKN